MRRVCDLFGRSGVVASPLLLTLVNTPLSPDLIRVARAFTTLQDARHTADYDLATALPEQEADRLIELAEESFAAWAHTRDTANAGVFLTALLLHDRWNRRG